MKQIILSLAVLLTAIHFSYGQSMNKKFKTLEVSRELPFSSDAVWAAVADDYGNVANSHPKIIASEYTSGSLKGAVGAQRKCYFNKKGTKMLHEEIVDWNSEEGYFVNRVLTANKFPVDVDNSKGTYYVESIGPNKSRLTIKFEFRTKPAFMGGFAKGSFKRLLKDYMIAVEHHISTGESVTASNFKSIKKNYSRS